MSTTLKDLFQRYAIPPSPLHAAVQGRAREAGWTPPWDREEQQNRTKSQQVKEAAKLSARVRTETRRSVIAP